MANEAHASGNWLVKEGREAEFVARWTEFLEWTRETVPGLVSASLIQDEGNAGHFVSIALWDRPESRAAWKSHDDFPGKLGACRELCEEFTGGDYELAVHVS